MRIHYCSDVKFLGFWICYLKECNVSSIDPTDLLGIVSNQLIFIKL